MEALIISDNKPGHVNQARALCNIAGWNSREVVVKYPFWPLKAVGYILDRFCIRVGCFFDIVYSDDGRKFDFEAGKQFDIVIAVGSASYYPGKVTAKKLSLPVIALMYPRGFRLDFDRIICPSYDNPPARDNITALPITLSSRDEEFYKNAVDGFRAKFDCQLPAVSVIIGGDNKYGIVSAEKTRADIEKIFELTPGHSHWVTTSRRTGREIEEMLESFEFDYSLIYSKQRYNPIPAFIALSDYIFVTSDSSSMISECVSGGNAKIEILKNRPKRPGKFDRFLAELADKNHVHIFDGTLGEADEKINLERIIQTALACFGDKGKQQ